MNEKLLNCPFCGGRADIGTDYSDPFESGAIYCMDCGAKMEFGCGWELRQEGIEKWNRRVYDDKEAMDCPM